MVDIIIGAVLPVENNLAQRKKPGRQPPGKRKTKERRKNRNDRRQGGRNCEIVVTLSKYPDRRKNPDRRKSRV